MLDATQPASGSASAELPERIAKLCESNPAGSAGAGRTGPMAMRDHWPPGSGGRSQISTRQAGHEITATSADLKRQYQQAFDQYERQPRSLRHLEECKCSTCRSSPPCWRYNRFSLDVSRLKTAGEPLALSSSLRDSARELST